MQLNGSLDNAFAKQIFRRLRVRAAVRAGRARVAGPMSLRRRFALAGLLLAAGVAHAADPLRLSEDRARLSEDRVRLSEDPVLLSEDRVRLSEDPVRPSEDPVRLSEDPVRLSEDRVRLSEDRVRPSEPSSAAAQVQADEIARWRVGARERIREQLIVPPEVPADAWVELEVSLLPSGNAADVSARRLSGFPAFDAAARRAVLAATPLPVPADAASYERVRRFAVIFEPRSGVQIVDAQSVVAPTPPAATPPVASPPERFVCTAAGLGPAVAPDCSHTGSRSALLNCFAQALQRRAARLVSVCAASAYPLEARRNHWEGTVHIGVGFDHGGKPAGISVAQSSGQPLLDQRALEIVQAALVPPPLELYATPFAVRVPMVFRMQRQETR